MIQSDASDSGWGAVRDKISTGGRWADCEHMEHINVLELQAAYFALKCLCSQESELHIQVQLDNSTAVAYFLKRQFISICIGNEVGTVKD